MADSPSLGSSGPVRLTVFSNGTQLEESVAFNIVSVTVRKAINRIPTAAIVLSDGDMPQGDFPISNQDILKPGREIEITAGYGDEEEAIFRGIVVRHGIEITGNNDARLEIECRDHAVAMTIGRRSANYVDSTDGAIVSVLIGRYGGLAADVANTQPQHKELVQYYCTDWDFMLSRAEVNGLLVIVDDGKVSVQAPQTGQSARLKVTYGEDLMELHADIDARSQLRRVTGATWDPKSQAATEEEVGPAQLNEQGNLGSSELAAVMDLSTFRLQTSAPLEQAVLKAWVGGRQVKAALARIRGRMKFQGSARAKAGSLIELDGVGDRFKGAVFVSAVHHQIADGNWITEVEFGLSPDWFAERRNLVAPPASGLTPGVEGLLVGVVKRLDGDPEGENKVQVSIPVSQAETEGVWARLAKFSASEGTGAFFIPEIGDEVVLGYFNNDPSHPVILGSLYSSKRPPPYELTAENYIKALVTTGKLKVEFDDEKKVITITTPANNKIVIDDKNQSILLEDENRNHAKLSPDGIQLNSPKDIQIKAQGKVTVDGTGGVEVKSTADVKIEGLNINNNANMGFVAKGSASAELSAAGQTTVKGALVMIN